MLPAGVKLQRHRWVERGRRDSMIIGRALTARRYRPIGGRVMKKEPMIESSGNVFADLGFSPDAPPLPPDA